MSMLYYTTPYWCILAVVIYNQPHLLPFYQLCALSKDGDSFHLEKLHMTEKETPIEIVEMEMELSRFLKKGVTKITREGGLKSLERNRIVRLIANRVGKPWVRG